MSGATTPQATTRAATAAFSRRQVLGLIGATGAAALVGDRRAARSAISCAASPAETIGPYFVEEGLDRSDITVDPSDGSTQTGVPLRLDLSVLRTDADCAPAAGVQIDVWHCNALGVYSDEAANGTSGKKFLRGFQTTDTNGAVSFTTVYPGWYSGRTIHVHFRVRAFDGAATTFDFVSQLYFDDAVSDQVMATAPYDSRGARNTTNATDSIFNGSDANGDGNDLLLVLTDDGDGGWVGTFSIGVTGLPSTGTTTTTTLDASDCGAAVSFAAASCRTSALRASVMASFADGRLRRRLVKTLDRRIAAPLTRAEAADAAGKSKRAVVQTVRAGGGVDRFRDQLTSRAAQRADASVLAALDADAVTLSTLLSDLQQTLL